MELISCHNSLDLDQKLSDKNPTLLFQKKERELNKKRNCLSRRRFVSKE